MENNEAAIIAFEDNKKLSNQLGYYIGKYIVLSQLPTLSCDTMQTRYVIKVTEEEQKKYKELNDKWYNKTLKNHKSQSEGINEAKKEWGEYRKFAEKLKEKYIPETLSCHIPVLEENGLDIQLFKEGIGIALWDCDMSYYECGPQNIEIIFSDGMYTFPEIILKRS